MFLRFPIFVCLFIYKQEVKWNLKLLLLLKIMFPIYLFSLPLRIMQIEKKWDFHLFLIKQHNSGRENNQ